MFIVYALRDLEVNICATADGINRNDKGLSIRLPWSQTTSSIWFICYKAWLGMRGCLLDISHSLSLPYLYQQSCPDCNRNVIAIFFPLQSGQRNTNNQVRNGPADMDFFENVRTRSGKDTIAIGTTDDQQSSPKWSYGHGLFSWKSELHTLCLLHFWDIGPYLYLPFKMESKRPKLRWDVPMRQALCCLYRFFRCNNKYKQYVTIWTSMSVLLTAADLQSTSCKVTWCRVSCPRVSHGFCDDRDWIVFSAKAANMRSTSYKDSCIAFFIPVFALFASGRTRIHKGWLTGSYRSALITVATPSPQQKTSTISFLILGLCTWVQCW